MFYTGLKVTRAVCTSVYEVQCATTTLLENFWIEQIALDLDAKEYCTIYNTYIIHELVILMLRDGLTRCDYC